MNEEDRINHPTMEYYREVYKNSPRWNGENLGGKRIIVYCEQGLGDVIQFFRYLPHLRKYAPYKLILHCPKELENLAFYVGERTVDKVIEKTYPHLPEHDYHVLSMSLPFFFNFKGSEAQTNFPYISYPEKEDLSEYEGLKIGIAWEGSQLNLANDLRNCPLKHFKKLSRFGHLFSLQKTMVDSSLLEGCDDLELLGITLDDFTDSARLINSLDIVISIDSSVLHLAGAMGKTTYGLVSKEATDGRFDEGEESAPFMIPRWYPNTKILFRDHAQPWEEIFDLLVEELK